MNDVPLITLNDGNTIPQLGLGVWQAADGDETRSAVRTALEAGYRMIDTASVYQNERSVGLGIRDSGVAREDIFITTKLWNRDQGSANVRPALLASLERLGLDYVDLYLIHWPTPARDLYLETWQEFEKLKDEGLIRSIGVSNFPIEDLQRLMEHSSLKPVINQIELHPLLQQTELREFNKKHGIVTESWSPIGGSRGTLLSDPTIEKIADGHGRTAAQIVIRWHIQNGLVVIPKSVHESRIRENIDVFGFELSQSEMEMIDRMDAGERSGPDPATMNNH